MQQSSAACLPPNAAVRLPPLMQQPFAATNLGSNVIKCIKKAITQLGLWVNWDCAGVILTLNAGATLMGQVGEMEPNIPSFALNSSTSLKRELEKQI
ncbi:unnamed protein product [Cuscuta campestris]|uniref:Uncharacterized protein n=1 Tax=Cuscuta campestris TaxID=132261 RepID=A0A484LCJ9_9ASTE|nr:unnamed protein product [Cuscuta campestris]